MNVTFLGTGAPLHPTRLASALLVTAPDAPPLLLDAAGGFEVFRALHAAGRPALQHVVLTHRHGDHIGGTMALMIAYDGLTFYGLPDTLDATEQLMQVCYPELREQLHHSVNYHPLAAGERVDIAGYQVSTFAAEHRVPTVALRVEQGGEVLAYSADSVPCAALVECARKADLFVCDALTGEAFAQRSAQLMHPSARQAAELAREAGARRLALYHLSRLADERTMTAEAQAVFPNTFIPDDGDTVSVG